MPSYPPQKTWPIFPGKQTAGATVCQSSKDGVSSLLSQLCPGTEKQASTQWEHCKGWYSLFCPSAPLLITPQTSRKLSDQCEVAVQLACPAPWLYDRYWSRMLVLLKYQWCGPIPSAPPQQQDKECLLFWRCWLLDCGHSYKIQLPI